MKKRKRREKVEGKHLKASRLREIIILLMIIVTPNDAIIKFVISEKFFIERSFARALKGLLLDIKKCKE